MSKVTCDICEKELEYTHENSCLFEMVARLSNAGLVFMFDFKIVVSPRREEPNFHYCTDCLLRAIAERIKP